MRSILAVALIVLAAAPAAAQNPAEVRTLVDRVDRLQRDVDVLQVRLARGGSGGNTVVAQAGGVGQGFIDTAEQRFGRLERQVQELTGRVEELGHRLEQLSQRLERFQRDTEFRLSGAAPGARADGDDDQQRPQRGARPTVPAPPTIPRAGAPTPLTPPTVRPGENRVVLVPGPAGRQTDDSDESPPPAGQRAAVPARAATPEEQYEQAFAQVREVQQGRGDMTRAQQAMRDFAQANPNHRLAGDARYWAGEMAFRRRDYRGASAFFADGLEKSPNGGRAPDTMLGLARALAAQNQRPQACALLVTLGERYPRASTTVKTQAQRERERLRCPS
ncbi:MAG: hypothetical protein JNL66_03390 [Alphaproteobacteria bacterium]|nr:hypothetical protein [Alphaproteobacteria bacterium]